MSKGLHKVYEDTAESYELVNHFLTLGLDILWRKRTAGFARSIGGNHWLDVCCGTGEMAINLRQLAGKEVDVVGLDFSLPMLQGATAKQESNGISFSMATADKLPFNNESFDLITISFATRNLSATRDILLSNFREFFRILKPGGVFINLETSQPQNRVIRQLFHTYVGGTVEFIGQLLSGHRTGYAYLSRSIRKFYDARDLAKVIRQSGFKRVLVDTMFFGVAAIHMAYK